MKSFICNICHKTFKVKHEEFRRHVLAHHENNEHFKPFGCHLCERRYGSRQGLNYHLDSYHNINGKRNIVHSCHFCNKSFKLYKMLQIHIKMDHNLRSSRMFETRRSAMDDDYTELSANITDFNIRSFDELRTNAQIKDAIISECQLQVILNSYPYV